MVALAPWVGARRAISSACAWCPIIADMKWISAEVYGREALSARARAIAPSLDGRGNVRAGGSAGVTTAVVTDGSDGCARVSAGDGPGTEHAAMATERTSNLGSAP